MTGPAPYDPYRGWWIGALLAPVGAGVVNEFDLSFNWSIACCAAVGAIIGISLRTARWLAWRRSFARSLRDDAEESEESR